MSDPTLELSLCAGIVREVRHRMCGLTLAAVGLFAALACLAQWWTERAVVDGVARFATQLLDDHAIGSGYDKLAKVVSASDKVVAAAYLSGDGSTLAFWPTNSSVEKSARQVASAEAAGGSALLTIDGQDIRTRFRSTPHGARSGRVVVWLRASEFFNGWPGVTLVFAAAVALVYRRSVRAMAMWLDRRVFHPLRSLAAFEAQGKPTDSGLDLVYTGGWAELNQLAKRFRAAAVELQAADRRARYLQRRSEDRLRASERTYLRRLKRTQAQALIDPLTRLFNRRFLKDELESIYQSQREGGCDLALVMIDLDDFKQHNDTCGHQAGDELLRFTGDLLRGSIRQGDYAVRYGGDEFVLIMPGIDEVNAKKVVRRILALFLQFSGRQVGTRPVSMSAGIATRLSERVECGQDLLARADAALYRAKESGKNTVQCSVTPCG